MRIWWLLESNKGGNGSDEPRGNRERAPHNMRSPARPSPPQDASPDTYLCWVLLPLTCPSPFQSLPAAEPPWNIPNDQRFVVVTHSGLKVPGGSIWLAVLRSCPCLCSRDTAALSASICRRGFFPIIILGFLPNRKSFWMLGNLNYKYLLFITIHFVNLGSSLENNIFQVMIFVIQLVHFHSQVSAPTDFLS